MAGWSNLSFDKTRMKKPPVNDNEPETGLESSEPDISLLLRQIEAEAVPDKLLALAVQLQAALAARRSPQK